MRLPAAEQNHKSNSHMRSIAILLSMTVVQAPIQAAAPEYGFKVVHVFPHDRDAFTEGFEYHDGFLYETTGLEQKSVLRKVRLETGTPLQEIKLDPQIFGEGFTVFGGKIFQLT